MAATAAAQIQEEVWSRSPRVASRYAWLVVAYNVLVIVWGALVRASGSGAGCGNHWPLCNGVVIPLSPRVDTLIEFTHRCMTGVATFAVLGLLVLAFRSVARGKAARVFAVASALLLLNEAFLGALLVKLGYVTGNQSLGRVLLLSIHLSNTLLLLAALTVTAVMLGSGQKWRDLCRLHAGLLPATLGLLATLVVGVTGSLAALGDTLFPSASLRSAMQQDFSTHAPMLLRLRWVHPVSAVLASLFVLWLLRRSWAARQRGAARILLGLLALQFILGLLDVLWLAPVPLQLLHLFGADLFWVALVSTAARSVWSERVEDFGLHIASAA